MWEFILLKIATTVVSIPHALLLGHPLIKRRDLCPFPLSLGGLLLWLIKAAEVRYCDLRGQVRRWNTASDLFMGSLVWWSLEPPWKKSDYLKAGEGQAIYGGTHYIGASVSITRLYHLSPSTRYTNRAFREMIPAPISVLRLFNLPSWGPRT